MAHTPKDLLRALLMLKQTQNKAYDWHQIARPNQHIPAGNWRTWLIMAGRGFGKTRTGAETVRHWIHTKQAKRLALVGATQEEAEHIMVTGPSGLMHIYPRHERPTFHTRPGKLSWNCGAEAFLFSGSRPEKLRGPQFDGAWLDEFAKYPHPQALWDQIQLSVRLGTHPRIVITTTPKPIPILKAILQDATTVVTKGSTYDNAANLAPSFLEAMETRYGCTALGAQELNAAFLEDTVGSVFRREWIQYKSPF